MSCRVLLIVHIWGVICLLSVYIYERLTHQRRAIAEGPIGPRPCVVKYLVIRLELFSSDINFLFFQSYGHRRHASGHGTDRGTTHGLTRACGYCRARSPEVVHFFKDSHGLENLSGKPL